MGSKPKKYCKIQIQKFENITAIFKYGNFLKEGPVRQVIGDDQMESCFFELLKKLNKHLYIELKPFVNLNDDNHFIFNPMVTSQWKESVFKNNANQIFINNNDILNTTLDFYLEKSIYINNLDYSKKKNELLQNFPHSRLWTDFNSISGEINDIRYSDINRCRVREVQLIKSSD